MGSKQSKGELQTTTTDRDHKNPDKYTCQICECIFYYSVRLPCGHSFCEVCVEVHWELESKQTEFLCPQKKCGQRWKRKPTLTKDTTLATLAEPARQQLVSETLDEIRQVAKEGGATDEGNASSPQSSPPAQRGGEEWSKACGKFVEIFPEWKAKRIEVLEMLAGMIIQLKKRARDGNISKVTGSSVSIAGGVLAITGLALIPVTFGASLGLSIAGAAIGIAGGITTAGASIAVLVMNNASTKKATENVEKDKIASERLAEAVKSVNSTARELDVVAIGTLVSERVFTTESNDDELRSERRHTWNKIKAATKGLLATGGTAKGLHTIVDNAFDLAGAAKVVAVGTNAVDDVGFAVVKGVASGGLRIAGIAVGSVFLVVDVGSLILAGIDLHKGSPSKIAAHWQKTYDNLKLHLVGMAKINDYIQKIGK